MQIVSTIRRIAFAIGARSVLAVTMVGANFAAIETGHVESR